VRVAVTTIRLSKIDQNGLKYLLAYLDEW